MPSDKRKIMFVDQSLNAGGAERVLVTLIRNLDTAKFNIYLVLISSNGYFSDLIPEHVDVIKLNKKHTRNALISFAKQLKKIKPDIIFTSLQRTAILSIIFRLFFKNHKLIVRYPSSPSLEIKEESLKGWRYHIIRALYRYADVVVAQTEEMAEELNQILKIPFKKIKVIYNPIDENLIKQSIKNTTNPYNPDKINILAIGRLCEAKAYDVLFKALSKVKFSHSDVHLHVIGEGNKSYKTKINQFIKTLKIEDAVTFHGKQKNPYQYILYSDMFVMSSRREGFPNALLESIYLKKPVIATDCIPIIKRIINKYNAGFIVETESYNQLANAIKRLTIEIEQNRIFYKSEFKDSSLNLYKNLFDEN